VTDPDEHLLDQIARRNWVILAVLITLSLWWQALPVTLGVATGGMVAILSYRWLHRSLRQVITHPSRASGSGFQARYLLRMAALAMILFLLLTRVGVHPLGLVVGLSVVVINILWATLERVLKRRQ
jgi:hypothetical protein